MVDKPKIEEVAMTSAAKSKLELIEEALLKNVSGGGCADTCGTPICNGNGSCYHDQCYKC